MPNKFSLRIPAALECLPEVHEFISNIASYFMLESRVTYALRLAVEEAVANIVMHGYNGRSGEIRIEITKENEDLVARLSDDAPPYNINDIPLPDFSQPLEERQIGGLGVFMIQVSMDEVQHQPLPGGGNQLTLIKRCYK